MMSSTALTHWNEDCSFPQFQLLFRGQKVEPPPWFIEALLVAFINDWGSVTDFENVMKQWTNEENVEHRDRVYALFSKNEVALPYLILGLNCMYSKEKIDKYRLLIDVDKAYIKDCNDFVDFAPTGQTRTIGDYITSKVDFSAMIKHTYGLCLYAISKFRISRNKPEEHPTFTEGEVESFLNHVFFEKNETAAPERKHIAAKAFFQAIKEYFKKPSPESSKDAEALPGPEKPLTTLRSKSQGEVITKNRAFIESVFFVIRGLKDFQEHLPKFKTFLHKIEQFIDFAKNYEHKVTESGITEHPSPNK